MPGGAGGLFLKCQKVFLENQHPLPFGLLPRKLKSVLNLRILDQLLTFQAFLQLLSAISQLLQPELP